MSDKDEVRHAHYNKLFRNVDTGKVDVDGIPIRCGDHVKYYEWKDGYRVTSVEDGWGRDIPLCRHDQTDVPPQEKTIRGVVLYSPDTARFYVQFSERMLNSGRDSDDLSMLCGRSYNKTTIRVIGQL